MKWICAFASPRRKNALALESSIFESAVKGWRGFLKRIFLSRVSKVFASGKMHKKLLDALEYRGEVAITKGVGIYNIVDTPPFAPKSEIRNFIYVGRFIPCKNLENLLEAFKKFPALEVAVESVRERFGIPAMMSGSNTQLIAVVNATICHIRRLV